MAGEHESDSTGLTSPSAAAWSTAAPAPDPVSDAAPDPASDAAPDADVEQVLATLDDLPLSDHPAAYTRIHEALDRRLAEIDSA